MNVICLIQVASLCLGKVACIAQADVVGKLISENVTHFYVDFTESAQEHDYINLTKRLVEKDKCVKVSEERVK
jgi:hypothetical protein